MPQNDNAVITAAVGYVFTAPPGTARPTPAQLKNLDAETFGAYTISVKSATAGPFTLTVGGTLSSVAAGAVASDVQTALEANAKVGPGNVKVTGNDIVSGFTVAFIGALQGAKPTVVGSTTRDVDDLLVDDLDVDDPDADLDSVLPVDDEPFDGELRVAVTITDVALPNGWKSVGHTSRGDLPELGYDGGDTEVRGTWQNESLREVETKPLADYLKLALHQFDIDTFELYYGRDASNEAGVFGVTGTAAPVEKALFIIIVDGDVKVGFYSPKASFRRDDSISLKVDEFAAVPVRATFLKFGSANKYQWVNADLFLP
jgi:hypothetical protein